MGDTGRKHNDEFEPNPEIYWCKKMGSNRSLKYLRTVVYNHQSSVCAGCNKETLCKEKEDK